MKKTIKNIIISLLGALLVGIGVGMWHHIAIGYDPLDIFFHAVSVNTGLTIDILTLIFGSIFVLIAFCLDRRQIGIGTILSVFAVSYGFSLGDTFFSQFSFNQPLLFLVIYQVIGMTILSFGASLMVLADVGKSHYDALVFSMAKRFNSNFVYIRYFCDAILFMIGVALNGRYGIGTFIVWFGIAPLMKVFIKVLKCQKNG